MRTILFFLEDAVLIMKTAPFVVCEENKPEEILPLTLPGPDEAWAQILPKVLTTTSIMLSFIE